MTLPTARDWYQRFVDAPHVMHDLLRQMIAEAQFLEQHDQGFDVKRTNKADGGSMEDIERFLYPQYSDKPFVDAFKEARGNRSLEWFATATKMGEEHLRGLMDGTVAPSLGDMAVIARVLRLHPGFFCEYREAKIIEALRELLTPQTSVVAFRNLPRDKR